MNKIGQLAFGSLLAANIFLPHVLSAQSGMGSETTRSADCGTCFVTLCNNRDDRTPNCGGGSYPCQDSYIDSCGNWVLCS